MVPQAPNRRAMLAWVALQDAPTPEALNFSIHPDPKIGHCIEISLSNGADLLIWADLLGLAERVHRTSYEEKNLVLISAWDRIAGWHVDIRADDSIALAESLDEATRAQLSAIAGDGAS